MLQARQSALHLMLITSISSSLIGDALVPLLSMVISLSDVPKGSRPAATSWIVSHPRILKLIYPKKLLNKSFSSVKRATSSAFRLLLDFFIVLVLELDTVAFFGCVSEGCPLRIVSVVPF